MDNHLVLIRGLPGSGKSTYARMVYPDYVHIEADMYFLENGEYKFDASKLSLAHRWCRDTTQILLESGQNIVVSNTFTQYWELEPYIKFAESRGIEFDIFRCTGDYGTIHNVPQDVIEKMKARFESIPQEII